MRGSSGATGNTVATFQGYPSLPSDDSGLEVEMEGPSHPANKAAVPAAPSPTYGD